eukprot:scaffold57420_cov64-Phaeocystis_antarctica.AAC.1
MSSQRNVTNFMDQGSRTETPPRAAHRHYLVVYSRIVGSCPAPVAMMAGCKSPVRGRLPMSLRDCRAHGNRNGRPAHAFHVSRNSDARSSAEGQA